MCPETDKGKILHRWWICEDREETSSLFLQMLSPREGTVFWAPLFHLSVWRILLQPKSTVEISFSKTIFRYSIIILNWIQVEGNFVKKPHLFANGYMLNGKNEKVLLVVEEANNFIELHLINKYSQKLNPTIASLKLTLCLWLNNLDWHIPIRWCRDWLWGLSVP